MSFIIVSNEFTNKILNELESINNKKSFIGEIDEINKDINGQHADGRPISRIEKTHLKIEILEQTNEALTELDENIKTIVGIMDSKNKVGIAAKLETIIHFTKTSSI